MEYITLKNSDLTVSRLAMGGCPMGEYGWGQVQNENLLQAVDCAIEEGINFFDTADTYGLGKSEENFGKSLSGRRTHAVIATKFGVRIENGKTFYDNSPKWIEKAIQGSLKRLRTDYVDLYQIHYRDGKTKIETIVNCLEKLKKRGDIRWYGLSNITGRDMEELTAMKGQFASFQNEFSLACRKQEKVILDIENKIGVSLLTWGSLGQGILTGKYDETTLFGTDDRRSRETYTNFHGEKLLKNLQIVEEMKKIAVSHHKSIAAVAVRWILDYKKEAVVLAGMKDRNQVLGNLEAFGWKLSRDELERLERISR